MTGGRKRASVLAVASGKGGVGKTNVAVNLAVALARRRHRVALLDADFGLGNVDVLLGLAPTGHIGDVIQGRLGLEDILLDGPGPIRIVPAGSGLRDLTAFTPAHRRTLADTIADLRARHDFLLIDSASGLSDTVIETLLLAERILLVSSMEPASVVDAYATVKVLSAADPTREIGLIVNGVRDAGEARQVHRQLDVAAGRFLKRTLRYYGFIAEDAALRAAVHVQRPVVEYLPDAEASRCFRILAARLSRLGPLPAAAVLPLAPPAHTASFEEVPQCA